MNKIFTDPTAAREYLEGLLWPNGPVCPHCASERATKLKGKSTRPGVYWCNDCQKPFSVTVGTVYERSHIPLNKWLYATHLMMSSKKGISAHQLMRMLEIKSYRSAWFMAHRIREGIAPVSGSEPPLGGEGRVVIDGFVRKARQLVDVRAVGMERRRRIDVLMENRTGDRGPGKRTSHCFKDLVER